MLRADSLPEELLGGSVEVEVFLSFKYLYPLLLEELGACFHLAEPGLLEEGELIALLGSAALRVENELQVLHFVHSWSRWWR